MLDELIARGTLYKAFERVRENGGCRGADGLTIRHFAEHLEEEIDRLQDRLLRRVYRPFPLLRIGIPKPTSGVRHLSIPTVRDRVAQTAVDLVTRDVFESAFEDCSHAYRKGRSVRTAVHRIRFSARLLNLDIFQQESFTSDPERGVLLRKEALRRYFVEYEKELGSEITLDGERMTWRQLFRRQAERLARALLEDVPYEAYRLPC